MGHSRIIKFAAPDDVWALLAATEELVMREADEGSWAAGDPLERKVAMVSREGSHDAPSVAEVREAAGLSGFRANRYTLLIREPLSFSPVVRSVEADIPARRGKADICVSGANLTEVLGLGAKLAGLVDQHSHSRSRARWGGVPRWWRGEGLIGGVFVAVLGVLAIAIVAVVIRLIS